MITLSVIHLISCTETIFKTTAYVVEGKIYRFISSYDQKKKSGDTIDFHSELKSVELTDE